MLPRTLGHRLRREDDVARSTMKNLFIVQYPENFTAPDTALTAAFNRVRVTMDQTLVIKRTVYLKSISWQMKSTPDATRTAAPASALPAYLHFDVHLRNTNHNTVLDWNRSDNFGYENVTTTAVAPPVSGAAGTIQQFQQPDLRRENPARSSRQKTGMFSLILPINPTTGLPGTNGHLQFDQALQMFEFHDNVSDFTLEFEYADGKVPDFECVVMHLVSV